MIISFLQDTTEDDFIKLERCAERLRDFGFTRDEIDDMALCCHICLLPGQCLVTRENAFSGAKTCRF